MDFSNAIDNINLLNTTLSQYVVQPLQSFGIAGFVFDIDGDARVELNNDITDHYLEDNSAIQDHIAVKPKKITLKNYIGELVYQQSVSQNSLLTQPVQKLTELVAFVPALTAQASQAFDLIGQQQSLSSVTGSLFASDANAAANIYGLVKNLLSAQSNKQQAAYQYFKAMRDAKMMFSIQTPFEFMNNMAIENITAFQQEDSIYVSSFSITMKEIRTASTKTVMSAGSSAATAVANPANSQGRVAEQAQGVSVLGTVPTLDVPAASNTYAPISTGSANPPTLPFSPTANTIPMFKNFFTDNK